MYKKKIAGKKKLEQEKVLDKKNTCTRKNLVEVSYLLFYYYWIIKSSKFQQFKLSRKYLKSGRNLPKISGKFTHFSKKGKFTYFFKNPKIPKAYKKKEKHSIFKLSIVAQWVHIRQGTRKRGLNPVRFPVLPFFSLTQRMGDSDLSLPIFQKPKFISKYPKFERFRFHIQKL